MPPTGVAALNTAEALDYYWGLDDVQRHYYTPDRLRLFEIVCEHMQGIYPIPAKIRCIDVGCGPGQMQKMIRNRFPHYVLQLVGIDFAASAIEQARVTNPGARFEAADLFDLDAYADDWFGEFDVVLCIEALEHQDDWRGAMAQLQRLARPAGHIIITIPNGARDDWNGHRQFWTLEDVRRDFADYGHISSQLVNDDYNILIHLRTPNATT